MFTLNDFVSRDNVPENDRTAYRQLTAAFEADLQPVGALEVALAADLLRCTWLIRHYASVDPATLPDDGSRHLLALRHNAAVKSFRWSTGQLRKTQTDREIGSRVGCHPRGLAGVTEILKATGGASPNHPPAASPATHSPQPTPKPAKVTVADMEARLAKQIDEEVESQLQAMSAPARESKKDDLKKDELKKQTQQPTPTTQAGEAELQAMHATHADLKKQTQIVPRNADCPCGSREKFKRCCGKNAPPVSGDWLRSLKPTA